MDWNHPPTWFIVASTWGVFGVVLAAVCVWAFVKLYRNRPLEVYGMRIYLDPELRGKVDPVAVSRLLDAFEKGLVPETFPRDGYRGHLTKLRCYLRASKLPHQQQLKPGAICNGITWSEEKIEVACDPEFWKDGRVQLERTAFLYELLNTAILRFDDEGAYVAYAEIFIHPTDEAQWRWFGDADGDHDVDAEDVLAWKARRAEYDALFTRQVSPGLPGVSRNGD